VYKPSALRKKLSTSLEKKLSDSQKKPSGLRWRRAENAFWKGVNFKDAYRMIIPEKQNLRNSKLLSFYSNI